MWICGMGKEADLEIETGCSDDSQSFRRDYVKQKLEETPESS